jgi:type II secretory pathway component PulC
MEKHNWVRHTVQPVVVSRAVAQTSIRFNGVILPESQSMFDVVAVIGGEAVSVVRQLRIALIPRALRRAMLVDARGSTGRR